MYKKIFLMSLLITSIMLAHNLPEEKFKELAASTHTVLQKEKLNELKLAHEKNDSELNKALSNLTTAVLVGVGTPIVYCILGYLTINSELPGILHKKLGLNFTYIIGDALTHTIINIGAAYATYKATMGFKHLIESGYLNLEDEVTTNNHV